ncbi:MAG: hypothetical protein IJ641_09385 [Lachnospiraceae bacterium]|nr:hypothetical protein [Lachnospiraceae bacterium]
MVSLLFAEKYNRKLIETVPVGVYLFMLVAYLLGISGHISHIIPLFIIYEAAGFAVVFYFTAFMRMDFLAPFKEAGNLIFVLLLVILWILSLHMRVTNFDDFHSWAITPKDMYYVNGLPTGNMASTFYRDYFPLVYIMDFFLFKLAGRYSEGMMFFVLWALMLVSLAEFLHRRSDDGKLRYICRVAAGIMLPFLVSFQFLHCLGLDILATTIFGSVLVYIMEHVRPAAGKEPQEGFVYIRIILATTVLSMMKTTSLILAAVCIAVYFVKSIEIKKLSSWVHFALLPFVTGVFWISWKIFCRIRGNTTYLSDNLDRNLSSGHMGFPAYTLSTVREFILKLFTYGLNDSAIGLTSVIILLLFIISYIIHIKINRTGTRDVLSLTVILLGMAGYLLVMIYVYLFVFEEWEALSLSSYDRYIATYFGAMLYEALFLLLAVELKPEWVMPAFMLLLALTINYPFVAETLNPAGYEKQFGATIAEIDAIEQEFMDAAGDFPAFGESILIVDHTSDQLRAKVLPYAAVPGVTRIIRPDENGKEPSEQEIKEMAEEYGARIIDLRRPE